MIVPLHASNPSAMTGSGNWTYFIPGRHPVLIDAGVGQSDHIAAIESASGVGPAHVVVTHAHGDHISGVAAIAARWPETAFSKYPWAERDAKYSVTWKALADNEVIAAGDDSLQVIHTPGHAPDHIALWHPQSRTVFTGDLVVAGTTVVVPATMGGSLRSYLNSLRRVLDLQPLRLLPAHGPVIDNPPDVIQRYLTHRQEREDQIRAALRNRVRGIDALVAHIYVGLASELVPMARESVLAHLIKLQEEGHVRREGDDWYLE